MEHGDAPKAQIAVELRDVLDSLRLTIDSLDPTENDLLSALGDLRYRLEARLKRQGIVLDWQVDDLPQLESLAPRNVLDILRIVQEAFTNILKHARARTITVRTGCTEGRIFIRISDDGCGFVAQRPGRGLANMSRRAQALGASLDIASSPSGTTLTLHLPLSLLVSPSRERAEGPAPLA